MKYNITPYILTNNFRIAASMNATFYCYFAILWPYLGSPKFGKGITNIFGEFRETEKGGLVHRNSVIVPNAICRSKDFETEFAH